MKTSHRPRRDRHLAALLTAVIAITGVVSAAHPSAVAAAATITALAADGPGVVADGQTWLTDATTTWTVTRSPDGNEVEVVVVDPLDFHNNWTVRLAAPAGSALAVGTYANSGYPQEAGHGKIDLVHNGQGCSPGFGTFTIAALTVGGGGAVTSFAATIEHHCQQADAPPSYIDLRYASSIAIRTLVASPGSLTFDPALTGHAGASQAATFEAKGTANTTVSSVTISGGNAADFAITANTCAGAHAPGTTCQVTVQVTPNATGPRQASLVLADDSQAGSHIVALNATGIGYAIAPLSLDFGSVLVDATGSGTITVTNGNAALAIGPYNFDWFYTTEDNVFSVRPNSGCSALATIPALGTCDVTIDFTPRWAGGVNAGVHWNMGGEETQAVSLVGTGMPTSGVGWGSAHTIRSIAWTSGNALARSTRTSPSAAYLHAVVTTDRIGGRWANNTSPKLGVYYRRSSNGGSSWATAVRINPTTKHADRGAVAASGSRVYVTYVTQTKWVNYSKTAPRVLYVRRNTSYGSSTSWKTAKRLTSLTGRIDYPSIAASGSNVYVAYTNASTGGIKLAVSHDKGVTWVTKSLGSTTRATGEGKSGLPSVSASGSLVVVSWTADSNGKVLSRISGNAGSSFSSTATLATTAAGFVTTGAASGRLSVAWPTADGATVRTWRPSAWGPAVAVTPPGAPGKYAWFYSAAIVLNSTGRAGIAWSACHADCDSDSPYLDLVWAESTDGAATFPHRQVIVNSTAGGASYPANWFPSVAWGAATTRYILYSADRIGSQTGYNVHIRAGNGAP